MATVVRAMACPPATVLSVLADGWTYAAWVVGASRIRAVDASWPAPGSRVAHSVGIWPALLNDETVVLEWRPHGGITLQARAWPAGEARIRIDVAEHGAGSLVRMVEDADRGPGRWLPRPLRTAGLVPRNRETLGRLALLAERRTEE